MAVSSNRSGKMKKIIISIALAGLSFIAAAGERAFLCEVKNIYTLTSGGAIETESRPAVPRVGDGFNVDRRTGAVVGERIPVFHPEKFDVLAAGTDGNGFALTYSARTRVAFLRIENYRNEQLAPFILQDGIWIATGTCK